MIEPACDVLFANAVAKAPIRPVPITTIFFTLLLLGRTALRRPQDQGTTTIFPICWCVQVSREDILSGKLARIIRGKKDGHARDVVELADSDPSLGNAILPRTPE